MTGCRDQGVSIADFATIVGSYCLDIDHRFALARLVGLEGPRNLLTILLCDGRVFGHLGSSEDMAYALPAIRACSASAGIIVRRPTRTARRRPAEI
jgi:hypothetical protein